MNTLLTEEERQELLLMQRQQEQVDFQNTQAGRSVIPNAAPQPHFVSPVMSVASSDAEEEEQPQRVPPEVVKQEMRRVYGTKNGENYEPADFGAAIAIMVSDAKARVSHSDKPNVKSAAEKLIGVLNLPSASTASMENQFKGISRTSVYHDYVGAIGSGMLNTNELEAFKSNIFGEYQLAMDAVKTSLMRHPVFGGYIKEKMPAPAKATPMKGAGYVSGDGGASSSSGGGDAPPPKPRSGRSGGQTK